MSTILLVDDDVHLRELSRIFLQQEGFTLAEASDGVEALGVFAQSKIDLVILDIMMPKMDGWKLCQELRRYSDVPILMLTARGETSQELKGFQVGTDDYLVARHPGQVYTLVAHEPPTHLLPETDPIQEMKDIQDVYQHSGVIAALQTLFQLDGLNEDGRDMMSELPASIKDQIVKNTIFFFEHELAMYDHYLLDFAALASATSQTRIVLAGGHDYQESATYLSAAAVADRLGTDMVEFPGRHVGYLSNPRAFAHHLREVLDERLVERSVGF